MTTLSNGTILLVGGRTTPDKPLKDVWLLDAGVWRRVDDLPSARYRHAAAAVDDGRILVYGGRGEGSVVFGDWLLWCENHGWRSILVVGTTLPAPRFAAGMCWTDRGYGAVTGGLNAQGDVLDDMWRFELHRDGEENDFVKPFWSMVNILSSRNLWQRFGGQMLYAGHGRILYVGGISGCGLMSSENEIVEFDCNRVTVSAVRTRFRKENTPFLIGHSVVLLQDRVVICGGGGECFGFGTCMNDGLWTLSDSEKDDSWQIIEEGQGMEIFHDMDTAMPDTPWEVANEGYGPLYQVLELKRVGISSAEDFREIVESSEPTLLEGVDFGPCVKVWTPEYLKATIGDEREVVVRLAESSAMSPQRFKTQKMLFREFIDIAFSPNLFVCSLSTGEDLTLPSAEDFPGLAQDFILPSCLAIASNNHHSYQLEITSADVGISLRYHVLAKILCLVSGHVSVRLYPPGDLAKLSFPHGATTSSMPNIFAQESPPGTSPYDVDLNPGDILFIPPLWLHSAKSLTACTAMNVFFKDPTNPHEAKLHPDRDLTAYGEGRKKLRGIAKDFQHLPRDVRRFYLSRLAEELKELDK